MTTQFEQLPGMPPANDAPWVVRRSYEPTQRWYIYGGLYVGLVVVIALAGFGVVDIMLTFPFGFAALLLCLYGVDGILSNLLPTRSDTSSIADAPTWWHVVDNIGWAVVFGLLAVSYVAILFVVVRTIQIQWHASRSK